MTKVHGTKFTLRYMDHATDAYTRMHVQDMNGKFPKQFHELQERHLVKGHWWLLHHADASPPVIPVGFCGMVPMTPFKDHWYLKRAAVLPEFRGGGMQREMIRVRERKAQELGCVRVVTECAVGNIHSANNLIGEGYVMCEPERAWADADEPSLYWYKDMAP